MPSENPKSIAPEGPPTTIEYGSKKLGSKGLESLIDTTGMQRFEYFVLSVNTALMREKLDVISKLPNTYSDGESSAGLLLSVGQKIDNLIESIIEKLNKWEGNVSFFESVENSDGYDSVMDFVNYFKVSVRINSPEEIVSVVNSELEELQDALESLADYVSLVKSLEASDAKAVTEGDDIRKVYLPEARREARKIMDSIPAKILKKNLGGFADYVISQFENDRRGSPENNSVITKMKEYKERWVKHGRSLGRVKTAKRERGRIEKELIDYFSDNKKKKVKPNTATTFSGHISLSVSDLNETVSKALGLPNTKVFKLVDAKKKNEYEKKRSSFPPPPDSKKKTKKIEIGESRSRFQKLMASCIVRIAICTGVFGAGVGVHHLVLGKDSKKKTDNGALIVNGSRDVPLTEEQRNRVLAFFESEGELTPELRIQINNVKTLGDMEGIIFLGFGFNTIRYAVQDINGDDRYSPDDKLTAEINPKVKRAIRALHYGDCERSEIKFGVIKKTDEGEFIKNQSEELDMTLREHCNTKTALVVTRYYKDRKENPFSHENQLLKPFCDYGEKIADAEFENIISLGILNGKVIMLDFQKYFPTSHLQKSKKLFFSNPALVEYKKRALLFSSVARVGIDTELITRISVSNSVQNIAQVVADSLNEVFIDESNLGTNKGADLKLSIGFKEAMNFLLSENPNEGVTETALEMEIPGGVVITTESYNGNMDLPCESDLQAIVKKGNTDIKVLLKKPEICDKKN